MLMRSPKSARPALTVKTLMPINVLGLRAVAYRTWPDLNAVKSRDDELVGTMHIGALLTDALSPVACMSAYRRVADGYRVERICVDPGWQRCGLERRLLEFGLEIVFHATGVREFQILTPENLVEDFERGGCMRRRREEIIVEGVPTPLYEMTMTL